MAKATKTKTALNTAARKKSSLSKKVRFTEATLTWKNSSKFEVTIERNWSLSNKGNSFLKP